MPLKVGFYGFGTTGRAIARELVERGHEVTAIMDSELAGASYRDVLEASDKAALLPTRAISDHLDAFRQYRPDVIVHATPRDSDLVSQIVAAVQCDCNVISISGISHLWRQNPKGASAIDREAKRRGVSVLGTGVNPGFITDVLPVFLSSTCVRVESIAVHRVANVAAFGDTVMELCGIGLAPQDFAERVRGGTLPLHVEIWQSADLILDALGWTVGSTTEEKSALVTETSRSGELVTIPAGSVCGYRHRALVRCTNHKTVELVICSILAPEPTDDVDVGTWVQIDGDPSMTVALTGDISERPTGAIVGRVVNLLGWVVEASPGLRRLSEIPAGEGTRGAGA